MKRFLIQIIALFTIVAIVDITSGMVFKYMQANPKGGATYRDKYICNEAECDILMVGSSRCEHHYNPILFEETFGKSCFNAGQSGNGIIVAYARYLMACERKKPELVVYDINPDFDLLASFDNHRYLTWLRSYYDKEYVRDIFETIDPMEKYKMMSMMYRYNSRFVEILVDFIYPSFNNSNHGFAPLKGEMDKSKIDPKELILDQGPYAYDPVKLSYIEKFMDATGGNLVIVISPRWYGLDTSSFKPLVELCMNKNIKLIDYSNNPKYVHNDIYFKDGTHLNARGANEFTKDLINNLIDLK